MNSINLFVVHNQSEELSELTHALSNYFHVYSINSFSDLKVKMNSNTSIVISEEDTGDSNYEEIFQWVKNKYSSCLRVLALQEDNQQLDSIFKGPPSFHNSILVPHSITQAFSQSLKSNLTSLLSMIRESERYQTLSITDPVTELTNHRFFQENLRLEVAKAQRNKSALSLIMIDVDHFKLLNDQLGHPEGDKILFNISQSIKQKLRTSDSVSRYGGEEFAILLPNTTSTQAYHVAETLRKSILEMSTQKFRTSISLGIATYPEHGLDADELLAVSDQALYCAKRQGRNMCIVGIEDYL